MLLDSLIFTLTQHYFIAPIIFPLVTGTLSNVRQLSNPVEDENPPPNRSSLIWCWDADAVKHFTPKPPHRCWTWWLQKTTQHVIHMAFILDERGHQHTHVSSLDECDHLKQLCIDLQYKPSLLMGGRWNQTVSVKCPTQHNRATGSPQYVGGQALRPGARHTRSHLLVVDWWVSWPHLLYWWILLEYIFCVSLWTITSYIHTWGGGGTSQSSNVGHNVWPCSHGSQCRHRWSLWWIKLINYRRSFEVPSPLVFLTHSQNQLQPLNMTGC